MKIRKKQRNQTPGILYLAQVNLYSKKTISIICLNFYLIISFAYMSCQSFMESMQDGIKNTKERVGADLILVPKDYSSSIENALFQGYPCTVYFEPIWAEEAEQVGGVEKVTTQVFLATLNAECCDNAVQLVGFDATTDYIIGPWLEQALGHTLRENQIVVGASLQQEKGDKVKYYGTEFEVAGNLEATGMGYDSCVFLSMEAAKKLAMSENAKSSLLLNQQPESISSVLIRVEPGYQIDEVKENLCLAFEEAGLDCNKILMESSSELLRKATDTFSKFAGYYLELYGKDYNKTWLVT